MIVLQVQNSHTKVTIKDRLISMNSTLETELGSNVGFLIIRLMYSISYSAVHPTKPIHLNAGAFNKELTDTYYLHKII